jgi:hypothetical protein
LIKVPHGLHATHGTAAPTSAVLGKLPVVSVATIAVQPCSFHSIVVGSS